MAEVFDRERVATQGWRQGAILGETLSQLAAGYAPETVDLDSEDWLVVTSHDCDIGNVSIVKEPVVEIVRMRAADAGRLDSRQSSGRNPRTLQLEIETSEALVVLTCVVHERWTIPRGLLMQEPPTQCLPQKERRLLAEWLAKRYIRAAFPTAFDLRWRSEQADWRKLLRKYSEWMQGVYLRLSTLDELPANAPYVCHLILAVPSEKRRDADWAVRRAKLEEEFRAFWDQFEPAIQCVDVEVLGTDEITLAEIEPYQRFDADWVSFEDESSTTPPMLDMAS